MSRCACDMVRRGATPPRPMIGFTPGGGRPARPRSTKTASSEAGTEPRLVALHPVDVAAQRVDLAVMGEDAEGLRERPGREGVGRVALVVDGEARHEARVE